MSFPHRYLLVWLLVFGFNVGNAQTEATDCEQKLALAADEFNAGHFYGIPSILKDCIRGGLTKEQSVRANLLLCQAYLIMDDPIAAEDSYLRLLKADPEYLATPDKDPIDVVYLSKKFTSRPVFTPHYGLGTNFSIYRSIYEVNTFSAPEQVTTKHAGRAGVQALAGVEWNISDNVSLGAEFNIGLRGVKTVSHNIADADDFVGIERQTWLDLPVYLKYQKALGTVRPFGYAGMGANLLIRSTLGSLEFQNKSTAASQSGVGITNGSDKSLLYQRNLLSKSIVVGGGVKYKVGVNFLYVDVRYTMGLNNLAKASDLYYDGANSTQLSSLATGYQYLGNLFRLDNAMITVGYVMPVYNPRKIKKITTRGLFKKKAKAQHDN